MIKIYSVLTVLLLSLGAVQAQNVVLSQDVNKDTIPAEFGPNRKHYLHFYTGLGWMIGTSDQVEIESMKSTDITFGLRYKRRLAQWYALGFEFGFNRQSFSLEQGEDKFSVDILPQQYKKEHIICYNLQAGLYQRFNFGKRGNKVGKFVDLGGYGTWTFDSARKYKLDDLDNAGGRGPEKIKVKEKDLNYIESLNYGVLARVGTNRFSVYSTYRLSDLLDKTKFSGNPELPPLVVGIQLGFH